MSEKSQEKPIGFTARQAAGIFNKSGLKRGGTFPHGFKIYLPYLPIEMFDIQGVRRTPINLMRLMEQVSWSGSFKDERLEHTTEFVFKYKQDIDPLFYHKEQFSYPLEVEENFEYVKRTSKMLTRQLRERGHANPLVNETLLLVNIDSATVQPKPFPDEWKQKYNLKSDGPPLDIVSPVKPSTNVLVDTTRVRFTDVDENNHMNYTVYVRMCLDVFYVNILHQKYPHGSKLFLKGWMKSLTIVFKKDSLLGDTLTIESWEDVLLNNTYHFEIYNRSNVAVAITFQFYTSLAESSRL